MIETLKHYNIKVTGKVQGVWYRKSTQQKASSLNITGYVKNQPDGGVFIEAEGNEHQLQKLIEWCNSGPEYAIVTSVTFEEATVCVFESFTILR